MSKPDLSEVTRFKTILATITIEHPSMPLHEVLLLADEIEVQIKEQHPILNAETLGPAPHPVDVEDIDSLAALAIRTTAVVAHMRSGKKINAIKELRSTSGAGLKAAKEAVELAFEGRRPTPPF